MVQEDGAFDSTLAAAAGDDPALHAELRAAFAESLAGHIDLLSRARCDGNWVVAAQRIKGLAASFHVLPLMDLADAAVSSAPGEPGILRKLNAILVEFTSSPAD
ncbi:hypothetical protein HME9302_01230 [Alteripontixanthobacter maritimus]|uniref:HPt domain-containing protein n=1 Tax=Alteripontixanthobacter maritimus TaxID=2161824 RepID=A0A369Q559_9SPHN|nr:Hpt domain-containing protein [Alteripontixanthobacter maritimus]RDC60031.1 hypothetical protein HME9302_01230 [Alteripontixanthobacter maritimus]